MADDPEIRANSPEGPTTPAPLFRWETLKELGVNNLQDQLRTVSGMVCEIELTCGKAIRVWRSADGQEYFCHGLTFGGKNAPGPVISPFTGMSVETLLQEYFTMIPEAHARLGDILVWRGLAPETTPHSAILTEVSLVPLRSYLEEAATRLHTKNGLAPEDNLTLAQLIDIYGESYNVYQRRCP